MSNFKSIAILPCFLLLGGCASLINGTSETVSVNTTPSMAACELSNNYGVYAVTHTPGAVTVHRSSQDLHIVCDKEPDFTASENVASEVSGAALGNILGGGLIGGGIDAANGSAFTYPSSIAVQLSSGS